MTWKKMLLRELSISYNTTYGFFNTTLPGKASGLSNVLTSAYAYGGWWSTWEDKDKVWCGNLNNTAFTIKDTNYTDAAMFKQAMGDTEIVYELATPIEYDITPQQIALLLGVNNVWNNCNGSTDITYKADTKLYIDNLVRG